MSRASKGSPELAAALAGIAALPVEPRRDSDPIVTAIERARAVVDAYERRFHVPARGLCGPIDEEIVALRSALRGVRP